MPPRKPLPTYPVTQPAPQPVTTYPASQPSPQPPAQSSSAGPTAKRRPPLADLGTPGRVSTAIEYLLYAMAVVLLGSATLGFIAGIDGLYQSATEPDQLGATLNQLGARAHFTWALYETCLAAFLAAIGIGLNHLRYVASVSKSFYSSW